MHNWDFEYVLESFEKLHNTEELWICSKSFGVQKPETAKFSESLIRVAEGLSKLLDIVLKGEDFPQIRC